MYIIYETVYNKEIFSEIKQGLNHYGFIGNTVRKAFKQYVIRNSYLSGMFNTVAVCSV